jgi:hypothetical protein
LVLFFKKELLASFLLAKLGDESTIKAAGISCCQRSCARYGKSFPSHPEKARNIVPSAPTGTGANATAAIRQRPHAFKIRVCRGAGLIKLSIFRNAAIPKLRALEPSQSGST